MKKIIAALGVLFVVCLASLSFAGSASAADGYVADDTEQSESPSGVDSSTSPSQAGVLPATGGPETALLIGGAALLAVGGTALVVSRRRSDA